MLVEVFRADPTNIGDWHCRPGAYVRYNAPSRLADIKHVAAAEGEMYVVGGGGLVSGDFPRLEHLAQHAPNRTVLWGVGHNLAVDMTRGYMSSAEVAFPEWVSRVALAGVRDYGTRFDWVPCASCMHRLFDTPAPVRHDVVLFEHKRVSTGIRGIPVMRNSAESLSEVLTFLASGDIVLTNSYHGAYWALLLGRRVIILPFGSKFFGFKHRMPLSAPEDWRQHRRQAVSYPEALDECRARNVAFHAKVLEVLHGNGKPGRTTLFPRVEASAERVVPTRSHTRKPDLDGLGQEGSMPVIASLFVKSTVQEQTVLRLGRSCQDVGVDVAVEGIGDGVMKAITGSAKADYLLRVSTTLKRPVLWVDPDSVLRQRPYLLVEADADFAIYANGPTFDGATIFFNHTPLASRLLNDWAARCTSNADIEAQVHLHDAWQNMAATSELRTVWLPGSYCLPHDGTVQDGELPVVVRRPPQGVAADTLSPYGLYRQDNDIDRATHRMTATLGERHREKILSWLKPGGRMLEWGSGASTSWFAERLPPGASLTSVEHDPTWHASVTRAIGERADVRVLLRPAEGPLGRADTEEEEDATVLASYVRAGAGERFDVVVIDGLARSACLTATQDLLQPGGVVFLHDSQRGWYDQAKRAFRAWGVLGACSESEMRQLWHGGLDTMAPTGLESEMPIVVCYFTKDTPYEDEARALIASCERHGLEHDVIALPTQESWEANCARKAEVCLAAWHRHRRPILWIDADATVLATPSLLAGCSSDFAIHRWEDWEFVSGAMFFNQTEQALRLLERWVERCQRHPQVWDQVSLDLAWEELTTRGPLDTLWLPRAYYQVFDAPAEPNRPTVIQQNQASRRLKRVVSKTPPRPAPVPSEALVRARLAGRTRRWLLSHPDSHDFALNVADEARRDAVAHGAEARRRQGELRFIDAALRDVEAEIQQSRDTLMRERLLELGVRLRERQPEAFAIYGTGAVGHALLQVVRHLGLAPYCFVETAVSQPDTTVLDVPVLSVAQCLEAQCHVYAIGSFASSEGMRAVLDDAYAPHGLRYEVHVPQGPSPDLPDLARATAALLRGRASLTEGHFLEGTPIA